MFYFVFFILTFVWFCIDLTHSLTIVLVVFFPSKVTSKLVS